MIATDPSSKKMQLSIDMRLIVGLLLIVIAVMLAVWRPWSAASSTNDRTVTVTGEATLTDKPDEYVFYPSYPFKNDDKATALAELTKKSDTVVAELKKLGVADSKIKTDSSNFDYPVYYDETTKQATYTLSLTITVNNTDLAQKVQDYLLSTTPSGIVTPQASFSDTKRKELENKARDQATKDARSKADQSAKNLGFKVAKVKSVTDGSGFGVMPYMTRGTAAVSDAKTVDIAPSLSIQPGENDLNYTVTVIYYID